MTALHVWERPFHAGVPIQPLLFPMGARGIAMRDSARADTRRRYDDLTAGLPDPLPGSLQLQLEEGRPADEIVDAAQKMDAQLIIMGTHGRSGLSRLVLGSVAERVIRSAPCPVLTIGPDAQGKIEGGLRGESPQASATA